MRRFNRFHRLWKMFRRLIKHSRTTESSTDLLYGEWHSPSQPPSVSVILHVTPFTCKEMFLQELQVAELVVIEEDIDSSCANANTELSAQAIAEIALDPRPSELPGYDYEDKNDRKILISILNDENYNISPEDSEVLESIINSPMINTAVIYDRESDQEGDETDEGLDDNTILMSILNSGLYDISLEDQEAMKTVLAYLESFTESTIQINEMVI